MIPAQLQKQLERQPGGVYRENRPAVEGALTDLGVPLESELGEFFLTYRITLFRSDVSDEQLSDVAEPTREVALGTQFVQEVWAVPADFVCLTSVQGEGAYLYDRKSGCVWDFDLRQRDAFFSGRQTARWNSYFDFMHWYLTAAQPAR